MNDRAALSAIGPPKPGRAVLKAGAPRPRAALARRLLILCAISYPLALLGVVAAFRLIGERWWLTTTVLYLPRIGWAMPLPFLTAALLIARLHRMLLTQLAALLVVLFPLMGLSLAGPGSPTPGAPRFRIFTLNVGLGQGGLDGVLTAIRDVRADIVVLEEVSNENVAPLRASLAGFLFQRLDQFVIASRFPIEEPFVPPEMEVDGRSHTRHYARCRLRTPAGPIRLYAVHPVSPHGAFDRVRGEGLREEILTGRALQDRTGQTVAANTRQRLAQVRALAEDAASSPDPVLIAGDTNLPGLSWALGHWLGDYQDAFAEAGRGFGYTYPAHKWVWMRIDRILGGSAFRFLRATTISPKAYRHLGLMAEAEIRPPTP